MVMRVTPGLRREQNLAADSELEEVLKYLLVADRALVRAQSALGEESGRNELAELIHTAGGTFCEAEFRLWPECDPWALVREGLW